MTVHFDVHIEPSATELVWWADTPLVPGLTIAASGLAELRGLVQEAVDLHMAPGTDYELCLVVDEEPLSVETRLDTVDDLPVPAVAANDVRVGAAIRTIAVAG